MALRRDPTARQLRLAAELRRMRDTAGFSAREAAILLGVSSAQISHIESGLAGVSEERLRRLAANYSCTDEPFIDALAAMATDRTRGWWEEYRGSVPTAFLDLAEVEHHATYRWDVDSLYVPGLLQTEDYARAVFGDRIPALPAADLDRRVRHRMQRKVILERPSPVTFEAVVHEAALRIRVSDRAAYRTQLAHLLDVSEADHVTVRVIPFNLDGVTGAGNVMMYVGGAVPRLDTVVRDAPNGAVFVDAEAQLSSFRAHFRKAEASSLDPERSRDFIHSLTKDL